MRSISSQELEELAHPLHGKMRSISSQELEEFPSSRNLRSKYPGSGMRLAACKSILHCLALGHQPWHDYAHDPRLTHFAVNTDDVAATQEFYGSVFGWSFNEYVPNSFVQILEEPGGAPMGAIQQSRELVEGTAPSGFECTFGVDDIDAVIERIVAGGGKIVMEKATIPNVGHLVAFQDLDGNTALVMEYDRPAE